jgi:hypothetical protein
MCRLRQFAGLDKACAVAAGDSHDARGRATATLLRYRCRLPLRWNPLPTRPNMSGRGDLKRTTKRLLVDLIGAGCVALAGNATASLIYISNASVLVLVWRPVNAAVGPIMTTVNGASIVLASRGLSEIWLDQKR